MNKSLEYLKNGALVFVSTPFFLILSVLVDRFFLTYLVDNKHSGLIFLSNAEYYYQTPEFSCTAKINSLGFRDREFRLGNKHKMRIAAIGDSFTFGWGVENNYAWPKILEKKLSEIGYNLEVANLGKPGGNPATYAQIAEKAIPLLKPELTIVAILQGDDLAQIKKNMEREKRKRKRSLRTRLIMAHLLKLWIT